VRKIFLYLLTQAATCVSYLRAGFARMMDAILDDRYFAVMVSGGGGGEGVSESQARDTIRRGDHIALATSNSLLNLGGRRWGLSSNGTILLGKAKVVGDYVKGRMEN
jgi:hypothetical protein